MKKAKVAFLCAFTVFMPLFVIAQDGVSIGIPKPNEKAILHVQSDDSPKGILVPRYNTNDRNNIDPSSSIDDESGLIIYNTDINAFEYFNGTNWLQLIPTPAKFNINMAGNKIINIADGEDASDVASKGQVDDVDLDNLDVDGTDIMTGNLNLGSNRIVNLAPSVSNTDAVNQSQLEALKLELESKIDDLRDEIGILGRGTLNIDDVPAGDTKYVVRFPSVGTANYTVLGSFWNSFRSTTPDADNDLTWVVDARSDESFSIIVQELKPGVQDVFFDYVLIRGN